MSKKWWLLTILWMGLIFFLSHQPSLSSGLEVYWDFILRKLAHMFEYATLTFLLIKSLEGSGLSKKKIVLIAFLISVFYAITDEYHQTFIVGRQGAARDVLIDSFGALLTVWLFRKRC